jgi:hypothetical protein
MPYDFLSLTNDALTEINEVNLDVGSFSSASGVHAHVKNAINAAIRQINQSAFEWPFYHQTRTVTLAVDQNVIHYASATETINFHSIRLQGDLSLNVRSQLLMEMDYEEYLRQYVDAEFNPSDYVGVPQYVFRRPDLTFGIYPPAKETYTLYYDSYDIPIDMVNHDDVPLIPEQFRFVIRDGALMYQYAFRGDPESAAVFNQKFLDGIKTMRGIYQNRYEYVRSTVRQR